MISVVYYSEWRADGCKRTRGGSGEVVFEVAGGGAREREGEGRKERD